MSMNRIPAVLGLLAAVVVGMTGCEDSSGYFEPPRQDTEGALRCSIDGQGLDFVASFAESDKTWDFCGDANRSPCVRIWADSALYNGHEVVLEILFPKPTTQEPVTFQMRIDSAGASFDAGYRSNNYEVWYRTTECVEPSGSITVTHEGDCYRGTYSFMACNDGKLVAQAYSTLNFADGRFDICEQ